MRTPLVRTTVIVLGVCLLVIGGWWVYLRQALHSRASADSEYVPSSPLGEPSVLGAAGSAAPRTSADINGNATTLLHGLAFRVNEAPRANREDGNLIIRIEGAEPRIVSVPILKGEWLCATKMGSSLQILSLTIGGQRLLPVPLRIELPAAEPCIIQGQPLGGPVLRVVDANTISDLDDVQLFKLRTGETRPHEILQQTDLETVPVKIRKSPLLLDHGTENQWYMVTADGYEFQWIAIDLGSPGERIIALHEAADLAIRVNLNSLSATPHVYVYEDDGSIAAGLMSFSGNDAVFQSMICSREAIVSNGRPDIVPHTGELPWTARGELHNVRIGRWFARVESDRRTSISETVRFTVLPSGPNQVELTCNAGSTKPSLVQLEGVLLLPDNGIEDPITIRLIRSGGVAAPIEITAAALVDISSQKGRALYWKAGDVWAGEWAALVLPFQATKRFTVPPGQTHYQEIEISDIGRVVLRVLDESTGQPLPVNAVSWVASGVKGTSGARSTHSTAVGKDNTEIILASATGPMWYSCRLANGSFAYGAADIHPGANVVEIRKPAECVLELRLLDREVLVPVSADWWDKVRITSFDGEPESIRCVSQSSQGSTLSSVAHYYGLGSGLYVIRLPQLEPFAPPSDIQIVTQAPGMLHIDIPLKRGVETIGASSK